MKTATIRLGENCSVSMQADKGKMTIQVLCTNPAGAGFSASREIKDKDELLPVLQCLNLARK